MLYLLDTDVCIDVLRRREPVSSTLRALSPDDLAISAMTVAELRYGALKSSDPVRSLEAVETLTNAPLEIVPFDGAAARNHAEIRLALRTQPIGERDLVIAATARAGSLTLVTRNSREFQRVPGLLVEDWSAP